MCILSENALDAASWMLLIAPQKPQPGRWIHQVSTVLQARSVTTVCV